MFNKKLKKEIEGLREEIEGLRRDFWRSQYPYGEVTCERSLFLGNTSIYYKSDYNITLYITAMLYTTQIKYSIKKRVNLIYLTLEYQKRENAEPVDVKQTFVIKNGIAVEIDKEVTLDSFDITGTV